jgi:hypothetical protein
MNVNVPVGVPPPGTRGLATAVKAISWPTSAGFTDELIVTDVPSICTVTSTVVDVFVPNEELPL